MISLLLILLAAQEAPAKAPDTQPPIHIVTEAVSPPKPIAPGEWVTDDDYPEEALRSNMQGVIRFALDVDKTGAVSACTIKETSGWPLLDDNASALIRRRARFVPATDQSGAAVPGRYLGKMRLEMPGTGVSPYRSWARVTRVEVDAGGTVRSCKTRDFGSAIFDKMVVCLGIMNLRVEVLGNMTGRIAKAGAFDLVEEHRIDGMAMPADTVLPKGEPVFVREASLTISRWGFIRACEKRDSSPADFTGSFLYGCTPSWSYGALPAPGERKAVLRISFVPVR